jgi:hypothetical protein
LSVSILSLSHFASIQLACSSSTLLLGPLVLGSRLVKLFLQALVHVFDADFQSLVLDAQHLGRLGSAVNVGSGGDLGSLSRCTDGDVGDLVTGEAVDNVDCRGQQEMINRMSLVEIPTLDLPISCPVKGPAEVINRFPPASGKVNALTWASATSRTWATMMSILAVVEPRSTRHNPETTHIDPVSKSFLEIIVSLLALDESPKVGYRGARAAARVSSASCQVTLPKQSCRQLT